VNEGASAGIDASAVEQLNCGTVVAITELAETSLVGTTIKEAAITTKTDDTIFKDLKEFLEIIDIPEEGIDIQMVKSILFCTGLGERDVIELVGVHIYNSEV